VRNSASCHVWFAVLPYERFIRRTLISKPLIEVIRSCYALNWHGIHGVSHWARVRNIGIKLASQTGANRKVVELFAFLHDSCRQDDGYDREHGSRAAHFAESLLGTHIFLSDREFELLSYACTHHTHGSIEGDTTVQTCWDADRLDLGRIGIIPDPARLCTSAARDPAMIEWAYWRSVRSRNSGRADFLPGPTSSPWLVSDIWPMEPKQ